MAMNQGLYKQVVIICRQDVKTQERKNDIKKDKFKFQGQTARSEHLFGRKYDWIEVNFSTREPYFLKRLFLHHNYTEEPKT